LPCSWLPNPHNPGNPAECSRNGLQKKATNGNEKETDGTNTPSILPPPERMMLLPLERFYPG